MSYYIAEELTIMPDKIISVGYSNNVFPRESVVSEIPRTDLEIEYIVQDLIGGMIQPRQEWWKRTQQLLREKFSWEDMDHKEKKQEAAQFLLNQYDTQIEDYERAEKAAQFLVECYIEHLEQHSNNIVMS